MLQVPVTIHILRAILHLLLETQGRVIILFNNYTKNEVLITDSAGV